MSDEERPMDPEVIADLALRNATTRERGRAREMASAFGDRALVTEWPCRSGCGARVGVTQAALDAFRMFSSALRKRGEEGLDAGAIVFCDRCVRLHKKQGGERARDRVDSMRSDIRELKSAVVHGNALKEREYVKRLDGKHPCLSELLTALRDQKQNKKRKASV